MSPVKKCLWAQTVNCYFFSLAKVKNYSIIMTRAALCWTEAAAGGNIMNQETKRTKLSVHDLVQLSVLIAIMLVPVIVGAIVMGPAAGALLGGVFGLISFWECFGKSAFGVVLMGINPFLTFLVCVPTRILAGWICGLVFQALRKVDKTRLLSFGAAGLSGALCNTAFFMTTLCLCFYNTDFIQGFVQAMGSANAFLFVIAFVGINGLVEAIVCFFTGAVIAKAVVFSSGKLAARRTAVQNGK